MSKGEKSNMNNKNNGSDRNGKDIPAILKENRSLTALAAFCIAALVLILIGVFALKTPVVAMCALVIIEAGIAVMLHKAELWMHGAMVLAQIIAGILVGRVGVIILCALVYAAATAALGMSDMDAEQDKKTA